MQVQMTLTLNLHVIQNYSGKQHLTKLITVIQFIHLHFDNYFLHFQQHFLQFQQLFLHIYIYIFHII